MSRIAADSSVFYAVADPTRRAILELLRDGEQSVSALLDAVRARALQITQSGFSQHLSVLRRAGLVCARKEGRLRYYRVEPAPLREMVDWVAHFDKFWDDKLDELGSYLDRTYATSTTPSHHDAPPPAKKARTKQSRTKKGRAR